MSEKYKRVFSSGENLHVANAPVVIRAGALLKDLATGKMIAQIKFRNISSKKISYLKAAVRQMDAVVNYNNGDYKTYIDMYGVDEVEIPEGVTAIPDADFMDYDGLKSVIIPDGVTSIGIDAFRNCTSLESITIPSSVTYIGERAFQGCTSLERVTIPVSIREIAGDVFHNCTNLKDVYYNADVNLWWKVSRIKSDGYEHITVHCVNGDVQFFFYF